MAVVAQPVPVDPPAQAISRIDPPAQLAQTPPGFDPERVINASEANLADYLNQPVHDILARLGLPRIPAPAPPPDAPDAETQPGAASPVDPSQMIKPVTDALGTLGTGQFNNADPTQMFQGIAQAFESAADPLQQAISGLGSVWQGAAASSAGATTNAALADGADVASQSTSLGESLSTVTASVRQAEARLMAIINEFWAKIAAIGPNIIFPWGIAQAIQAASEAVTDTAEVMSETQGTMGVQAASVAAVGAPVAATAATPSLAAQSFAPLLQMATGLTSPVMQGVSAATQAAQAGNSSATGATGPGTAGPAVGGAAGAAALDKTPPGGAGGSAARGVSGGALHPRLGTPLLPRTASVPATAEQVGETGTAKIAATGMGAAGAGPMGGGGPMGSAGKAGGDGRYSAASFLHTSNDQIVGDLGGAAPPVIGQADPTTRPDVELRI
jgi:hypothetical protein